MKNKHFYLTLLLLIGCSNTSPNQTDTKTPNQAASTQSKDPLAHFKTLVANFSELAEKKTPYFTKSTDKSNSTNPSSYYLTRMILTRSVSYDVTKTDSLVSPYTAKMDVYFNRITNGSCGDKKTSDGTPFAFTTAKLAVDNKDKETCFVYIPPKIPGNINTGIDFSKPIEVGITYTFAYQDEKWVLKDIKIKSSGGVPGPEASVFDFPNEISSLVSEPEGVALNKVWQTALEQ